MALFLRNSSAKKVTDFNYRPSFFSWQMNTTKFTLLISFGFVFFYNTAFFHALAQIIDPTNLKGFLDQANLALCITAITAFALSLIVFPYIAKPFTIFMIISAAFATYFMNTYGIIIHKNLILTLFDTNIKEVRGFLNSTLILYVVFLGIAPSLLVARVKLQYGKFTQELLRKLTFWIALFITLAILLLSSRADYLSLLREKNNISLMANPLNIISATIDYLSTQRRSTNTLPASEDATLNALGQSIQKPTLLILVVGESARADHLSINGYSKPTTPLIAQQDIINYSHVTSCGTEDIASLPCMFSTQERAKQSDINAKSQESILNFIKHSGYSVLWRDNNSNCKGTCEHIKFEDLTKQVVTKSCGDYECFDDILLHELDNKVAGMQGSKVIVLHQNGSHGPDYFHRYPKNMEIFKPVCRTNILQDCSSEEINNAYDNAIHYTDYFLNNTIEWLKTQHGVYNTALIYLSDHGESLGENNIYLHGMPYAFAPIEQKHIPFFFWFSNEFEQANKINEACLRGLSSNEYSHANLFHTLLGLLNIDSHAYKAELDMVKSCREL